MPLQENSIDIPFRAGLDESVDKHANPSGFLRLHNGQYKAEGGWGKRHGFRDVTQLQATSAQQAFNRAPMLMNAGGSLLFPTWGPRTTTLASLSDSGRNTNWVDVAVITRTSGEKLIVVFACSGNGDTSDNSPSVCIMRETGEILLTSTLTYVSAPFGRYGRVVDVGGGKFILAAATETPNVDCYLKDVEDLLQGVDPIVRYVSPTIDISNPVFDVCSDGAGTWWLVDKEGSSIILRRFVAPTMTELNDEVILDTGSYTPVRLQCSYRAFGAGFVYVVGWKSGELPCVSQCSRICVQQTQADIPTSADSYDDDNLDLAWDPVSHEGLLLINRTLTYVGDTAAAQRDVGGPYTMEGWFLSQATADPANFSQLNTYLNFHALGEPFAMLFPLYSNEGTITSFTTTWQVVGHVGHNALGNAGDSAYGGLVLQYPNAVVLDLLANQVVGTVSHDNVAGIPLGGFPYRYHSTALLDTDSERRRFALVVPTQLAPNTSNHMVAIIDNAPRQVDSRTSFRNLGLVARSMPIHKSTYPQLMTTFVAEPFPPMLAADSTGLTGTYSVKFQYELVDTVGNIWLSPLSLAKSITLTNQGLSITYQANAQTTLADFGGMFNLAACSIKVWVTEANSTVYHLAHQEKLASFGNTGPCSVVLDTITDESGFGEILNDTLLDSEPIPPLSHVWTHRNRLMGVRSDVFTQVVYTNEFTPPETPRWNAALSLEVLGEGGRLVAGASLDDKIVLFQEGAIRYSAGFGLDNTGNGSNFSQPEKVPGGSGVNYANRNSVVTTPDGVMFRHSSGIGLVSRDLSINLDFGEAVRDTLADYAVRRAEYLPSFKQTWLLLEDSDGRAQSTWLVYDCRFKRWSTFSTPLPISDVIEHRDVVYAVMERTDTDNPSYVVCKYDPDSYADYMPDPTTGELVEGWVEPTAVVPWFRGAGRAACARVWKFVLEGRYEGPTDLEVKVRTTDAERDLKPGDAILDSTLVKDATTLGAYAGEQFAATFRPTRQRCAAMQLEVTLRAPEAGDTDPDHPGLTLTNLQIVYGSEPAKGHQAKKSRVKPT